jgi:hypothetical protein
MIAANMIREIWEDSIRHADDKGVNNRTVEVVENGQTKEVTLMRANAYIMSICTRAVCTVRYMLKLCCAIQWNSFDVRAYQLEQMRIIS